MSLARQIAYNTALQTGAKITSTLLAIVAFGLMARYLDRGGFGAYTTITAFLQFFGILVDMGLSVIAIQLISEIGQDHKKNFDNIFTIRLLSAVVIYALAPIAVLFFPYPQEIKIGVLVMAPSFFLSSLIQISTVVYQVRLSMIVPTCADITSKLFLIGGIALAARMDGGLVGVLAAILFNNALQWGILFFSSRAWALPRLSFDWYIWRLVYTRTWPIALSILCNVVYLRADTLILSLSKPQEDVGIYGAAFRVVEVLMTFPIMFIGLTLASFARAWSSGDMPAFSRYFQKTFDFMALTAFPLIVGTLFTGAAVMVLVAGPSFFQSGTLLMMLIVATGAIFFGSLFGHLINIINEQKKMLVGYFSVAVIAVVCYLVFIPSYGYWAAASITIATETAVALIGFFIFYKKTRVIPRLGYAGKTLLASGVMGVFLYAFPNLHLAIKIVGGGLVYISALYLVGALTKEMIASLLPKEGQK
ncbi:flippase [Candidatus Uhrbacteria bacterium]|nr:flippase [Candidatus Uhrbacteria bacterium]